MSELVNQIKEWRDDPVKWLASGFFGEPIILDKWQQRAITAFASKDHDKMKIALSACAGPGKSFVLAICAWYFLFLRGSKDELPKGIVLSVTRDNLRSGLWSEIGMLRRKSKVLTEYFEQTAEKIYMKSIPEWALYAKSFPKGADKATQLASLAGLHAANILYLFDEVGSLEPALEQSADQGLAETRGRGGFAKLLMAGNPISKNGLLYSAVTSKRFYVIRITGDPDDSERSPRISLEYAKEMIAEYGRDSNWIKVYLLGQFPDSDFNTLLGYDEVIKAMGKCPYTEADIGHNQRKLGVDVARYGSDATVIYPRQGLVVFKPTVIREKNGVEISSVIQSIMAKWTNVERISVDGSGGYGSTVIDNLSLSGITADEVQFSGKADSDRFYNKRTEMWFRMAEAIKSGLSIPMDKELLSELISPTYEFRNGKLLLESKKQIVKRLGKSPDKADSLALTFFQVDQPKKHEFEYLIKNRQKAKINYDPLDF